MMSAAQELQLPPGFRFHPTDEELVMHYLCRRCAGAAIAVPIIAEIDLYKFDPWQLPKMALYGEKEWYFFSPRDRKYPNGSRPNRAAGSGYWKATGADKPVGTPKPLAIKKALVFYAGKAPKGEKTNWIMHEYRLADVDRSARKKNSLRLDDWVLCRIYNKKGGLEQPGESADRKPVVTGSNSNAGTGFMASSPPEQKPFLGTNTNGGGALCYESDAVEGMLDRLVPDSVESEVFWARYFHRVHKLKQQEDTRAKLVKRVIAQEDEEDLSWEVDEDDEVEEEPAREDKVVKQASIKEEPEHEVEQIENKKPVEELEVVEPKEAKNDAPQPEVFGSSMVVVDKEEKEDASKSIVEESSDKKTVADEPRSSAGDDAVKEGAKNETSDSSKDSDYSLVSRQQTATEDDLEWDEIEDLGEHEEKKGDAHGSSPAPKEELRKRLSVAEDDEDLSWDIEDDDDKA